MGVMTVLISYNDSQCYYGARNIHDAVRIMLENKVRHLVVVDSNGKVIDLLSRSKIVYDLANKYGAEPKSVLLCL